MLFVESINKEPAGRRPGWVNASGMRSETWELLRTNTCNKSAPGRAELCDKDKAAGTEQLSQKLSREKPEGDIGQQIQGPKELLWSLELQTPGFQILEPPPMGCAVVLERPPSTAG